MEIRVANVRLDPAVLSTEQDFWAEAARQLEELRAKEVQVVLFPGYTGLLHGAARLNSPGTLQGLLHELAFLHTHYERGFAELAAKHRLYLCPGTSVMEENNRYYIVASLFDPQGRKLGEQRQTHLSRQEQSQGFARGEELPVWTTDMGTIGIVAGTDIWHPEVSRILALQGADLVLAPVAVPGPYNPWLQVAGMWQQVQQNQFFALENWLHGSVLGTHYEGEAVILAPCEMTEGETGYLAREQEHLALLNFRRREEVIKNYPLLAHLNRPLYKAYLPNLYGRGDASDSGELPGEKR